MCLDACVSTNQGLVKKDGAKQFALHGSIYSIVTKLVFTENTKDFDRLPKNLIKKQTLRVRDIL